MYNIYKYICNLIKINNKYICEGDKKNNQQPINKYGMHVGGGGIINITVDLQIWE